VPDPIAERYLRVGLQLGRHDADLVDSYIGPPELAAEVEAAPAPAPPTLIADAQALLDELEPGWLRDQVLGVQTHARLLAGEPLSLGDEGEGCYGYRPEHTDESVFEAAHAELDELLPGDGTLGERYEAWRAAGRVPPERMEGVLQAVIAEARAQTGRIVELPGGEGIELELVHDRPWAGFNRYLGDLRGRISVNVDLPRSGIELLQLAIHETYPGHQAERALKEQHLIRARGLVEETLVLVAAPQSLIAEGIAEMAPGLLLHGGAGAALAAIVADAGVPIDLEHALAVERAAESRRWAQVNAALLLHDGGGDEAAVRGYIERWALASPRMSAHWFRFMSQHPSRAYILTYAAGRDLCRAWVGDDMDRFRRLLGEQVRVADLTAP
jgi:hypothetical protein